MSRKVLIVVREEGGVTYGRVVKATEQMLMQDFAHSHVENVVRDKLMRNAAQAEVAGFNHTLPGGMGFSVGEGHAIDVTGRSFDTLPSASAAVVVIPAAHASLPRIDLVYATLVADSDREEAALPFRRLLTQDELAAGANPYPITNSNVPTRRDNIAIIGVRQGVAASVPAAPAAGVNEVALYQVRVNAGVGAITADKVTDVRRLMKSLNDALVRLDALEASPAILNLSEAIDDRVATLIADSVTLTRTYDDAGNLLTLDVDTNWLNEHLEDRVAALIVDSTYFTKTYNDASGLLTLDLDLAALDPRYVNISGDTMTGQLKVGAGGTDPYAAQKSSVHAVSVQGTGSTAVYGYAEAGSTNGDVAYGAFFHANANRANAAAATVSYGLYSETGGGATRWAAYFNGNVHVSGILTKSSGTFRMDHPVEPDAHDLVHGFLESNRFGLLYWFQVALSGGEAEVNLDAALGFMAGTARLLLQNVVVLNVRHPAGAFVVANVFVTSSTIEMSLNSGLGDSATVTVFIAAERADAVIKLSPFVDGNGLLIPEHAKPALTAEDQTMLAPAAVAVSEDNPLLGQTVTKVLPPIIGKVGYRWQPETEPFVPVVPTNSTAYVPEGLTAEASVSPADVDDDAGVGTRAWTGPLGIGAPLPTYLATADDTPVEVELIEVNGTADSHFLKVSDFGLNVPADATVRAVVVEVRRRMSDGVVGSEIVDNVVSLMKGGVVQAANKADTENPWQTGWVFTSYVFNEADLAGFVAADFNEAGFGVALSVHLSCSDPEELPNTTAAVDYVRVVVHYE